MSTDPARNVVLVHPTRAAVTEIAASHSVYVSRPEAVASLIKQAGG